MKEIIVVVEEPQSDTVVHTQHSFGPNVEAHDHDGKLVITQKTEQNVWQTIAVFNVGGWVRWRGFEKVESEKSQ